MRPDPVHDLLVVTNSSPNNYRESHPIPIFTYSVQTNPIPRVQIMHEWCFIWTSNGWRSSTRHTVLRLGRRTFAAAWMLVAALFCKYCNSSSSIFRSHILQGRPASGPACYAKWSRFTLCPMFGCECLMNGTCPMGNLAPQIPTASLELPSARQKARYRSVNSALDIRSKLPLLAVQRIDYSM